jgi:hypothetical protein
MKNYFLAAGLATIAFPTIAFAAPQALPMSPAEHQEMPQKDGCCPEKKGGGKPDDCCKGMKCCDAMKPSKGAAVDAHSRHEGTH